MPLHIAILKREYCEAVLAGRKTIESRLTRTAGVPFNAVRQGDRLYIKQSGGSFRATAIAGRVWSFDALSPDGVDDLCRRFRGQVGGDDAYWASKRDASYATFIELLDVEPCDVGPAYKPAYMKAWYVLDESASPLRDVTLTAGAIRNGYLRLPGVSEAMREAMITLIMPDGREVQTAFGKGVMLRWRGWRALYAEHGLKPGDTVRLLCEGDRRYRVSFHPR